MKYICEHSRPLVCPSVGTPALGLYSGSVLPWLFRIPLGARETPNTWPLPKTLVTGLSEEGPRRLYFLYFLKLFSRCCQLYRSVNYCLPRYHPKSSTEYWESGSCTVLWRETYTGQVTDSSGHAWLKVTGLNLVLDFSLAIFVVEHLLSVRTEGMVVWFIIKAQLTIWAIFGPC